MAKNKQQHAPVVVRENEFSGGHRPQAVSETTGRYYRKRDKGPVYTSKKPENIQLLNARREGTKRKSVRRWVIA